MACTTKKAEKTALMKVRRKAHKKLVAKQKLRGESKKGLGGGTSKSHPHRSTPARRNG